MTEAVSIPCGHEFSKAALTQYLRDNAKCPICKKKAQVTDFRPALNSRRAVKRLLKKIAQKG